jgi:hypothetical protein
VISGQKKLSGPAVLVARDVIDGVTGLDGGVRHASIVHELKLFMAFADSLAPGSLGLVGQGRMFLGEGGVLDDLGLGVLSISAGHRGMGFIIGCK